MMKTKTIIFGIVVFLCLPSMAQPAKNTGLKKEKMEAHRVAFLSHQLNLTPEEAQKFWPVYNQYQNEKKVLLQNFRKEATEKKMNTDEFSDKELEEQVMKEMEFSQKKLDLKKQYYPKFKEVLPIKKVARLYKAENDLKKGRKDKMQRNHNELKPHKKGDF